MPGSTSRYGINYPLQTDSTNVPGDIESPMDEIDAFVTGTFENLLADRPLAGIMGRRFYASDTGNIYFDTGSVWLNEGPINTSTGNIQSLAPGQGAAVGTTGFTADAGHKHPLPNWGANADYQPAGTTGAAGSTGRFADAGHIHPGDAAGVIKLFAGTSIPSGYLLCNGQTQLTSSYPALFAAIGYTWGGSGANFLLPNFTDRSPVGALNTFNVGQLAGASQVTLTAGMLAAHSHTVTDPTHAHPSYIQELGPSFTGIFTMNTSLGNVYAVPLTGNAGGGALLVEQNSANHWQAASTGISVNLSSSPSQAVPLYHPVAGCLFMIRAY